MYSESVEQPRGTTGIQASVQKSANETCEEIRGRDPCTELYRTGPPTGVIYGRCAGGLWPLDSLWGRGTT